jgi:hypothetical protein
MNTNLFGWSFTKGTTDFWNFWGDVHTFSVRADKKLETRADLEDVVERFLEDKTQFDHNDFSGHSKFVKASREYFTLVEKRKDFQEITFEFEGKVYKTRTSKWSVQRDIEKKAHILKWVDVQTISLVRDDNDEVITVVKELGKVNHLLDDLSDTNDPNSFIDWN